MDIVRLIMNLLLVAACVYTMYTLEVITYQFAFASAGFGLGYGLLGLVAAVRHDTCDLLSCLALSFLEIASITLVNVEVFKQCGGNDSLAYAHLLSFVPLAYDLVAKLLTCQGSDADIEILLELIILGNIASLLIFGVMHEKYMHMGIAGIALLAKYGINLTLLLTPSGIDDVPALFYAAYFAYTTYVISEDK